MNSCEGSTAGVCRECGAPVTPTDNWTSEQLQVCSDCWWNELDGEQRREIAREANDAR